MNRTRFTVVTALIALGALAPGSVAAAPPHAGAATTAPETTPININTADVKELMKLQGVGRSLAEKIVQHRDAHGPFKKAGDFRKVEGVGDGVWEKNRERIVVK
jgi:competence protein ComEA